MGPSHNSLLSFKDFVAASPTRDAYPEDATGILDYQAKKRKRMNDGIVEGTNKMTPQQQRQYIILRHSGWEYDYTEDNGDIYMNRDSDSSSQLATMIIKLSGELEREKFHESVK